MRKLSMFSLALGVTAVAFLSPPNVAFSGELGWTSLAVLVSRTPVDIHRPQACDQCRKEACVLRTPVQKCVKGKKRVYNCKTRNEYVAIPETRYRWVTKRVTKEIPCCYCKPVCHSQDVPHCYQTEQWQKEGVGICSSCGGLYCKHCQNHTENLPCKYCGREPGQTTIKVHYRSCVKVPYTVYRQVKRPVCVKQPRYEHVKVPITKYVCDHCNSRGCSSCRGDGACDDPGCGAEGCDHCADPSYDHCDAGDDDDAPAAAAPLPSEELVGAAELAYPEKN